MSKFKYPVSMVVTKEQFEADLRKPLEELGYDHKHAESHNPIFCTNCDYISHQTVFLFDNDKETKNRYFIDHYNPDLFIALASIREGDEPHVGEWFVFNNPSNTDPGFLSGNLYKLIKNKFDAEDAFLDGRGRENGYSKHNYRHFKKATKEQIIQHFSKKQNTMNGGMHSDQKGKLIGYKLIKPEYEAAALEIANKNLCVASINKKELYNLLDTAQYNVSIPNLRKAGVLDLWFEKVYQEQERFLTVNCDQGQFSVKRTEDGYEFEGKVISLPYLKALRDKMNGYDTINGWNIAFAHVSIGCKSGISIMELQKLIDQHSQNAF